MDVVKRMIGYVFITIWAFCGELGLPHASVVACCCLLLLWKKENLNFFGKKTTRSRQEDKEDQEEGKILITFENKKEANDSVATGILPQYGDPRWG